MNPIRIGLTMGDPAGIGAEVIGKALKSIKIKTRCEFFVIGDKWVFSKTGNENFSFPFNFIDLNNVSRKNFSYGRVRADYGNASIEYLVKAAELIKNNAIDCIVTAPISKEAINLAGYKLKGHTEFLAEAFSKKQEDIVMMLLNKYLKISLVTRHIALSQVSSSLNDTIISKTIIITYKAMQSLFGIPRPKIGVAALNPHAGEAGLLGRDEKEKIVPAVKKAKKIIGFSKSIIGPLSSDSVFQEAMKGQFDSVIAMYHDQALIPLKLLSPDTGSNLTLGLGFVRTSPLHGTAFDIAGKGIASSDSFVAAIETVVKCARNKAEYIE